MGKGCGVDKGNLWSHEQDQRGWSIGDRSRSYCLWWCQGVSLKWRAERDTAQYPVNQWIEVGEPVVSQHCGTAWVQWSYIKCYRVLVPWREMDQKVYSGADDGICGAIKKLEWNQIDVVSMEVVFRSDGGVEETMSGTRVYEGMDRSIWNEVRGNGDCKGVWIVKSGCVESWLHRCTGEFNAVLSWCRVKRTAHGFFDFKLDLASEVLSMTVVEWPLAVEDVALEQSFTTCPPLPQKRHRFWLKQCWHSCWVSLPSFPSFEERSDFSFFWLELLALVFPVVLEVLESLELVLMLLLLFVYFCQNLEWCCCCFHWCPCLCHWNIQASEQLEFLWPPRSGIPNNESQWIGWGYGVWRGCWVCRRGWFHPWFGTGAHGTTVGVGWLHPIGHRQRVSWSWRGTSLCADCHACGDFLGQLWPHLWGRVVRSFFLTLRWSRSNCRARPDWDWRSTRVQTSQALFHNANVTLALSVEKASGWFLKLRVHWTRNGCSLQVSKLSKTSSSWTLVCSKFFFGADRLWAKRVRAVAKSPVGAS